MTHISRFLTSIAFLTLSAVPALLAAENIVQVESLPQIQRLQRGDPIYDQLIADLNAYYRARSRGGTAPALALVHYIVQKGETIFTISSRFNLPHSTIASLNRISNSSLVRPGRDLLIPNAPGIYLTTSAQSQLEQLLSARLMPYAAQATAVHFLKAGVVQEFLYFPSEDFSPKERMAFLGSMFQAPLDAFRISSTFGPRKNPFSGQLVHHNGLDLASPRGTTVKAAADGTVTDTGSDPIYGNFIIIDHSAGYETLYGHLQRIIVRKGDYVYSGQAIGNVGSTGQATGPHLHFEIHYDGVPKNPADYIHN